MANKLYPPQIAGALPAFYINYDGSNTVVSGASIRIPFTQSAAVSNSEIGCFVLRLRTASTGSYLFPPIYSTNFNLGSKEVTFNLPSKYAKMLNEGQYYKAQIAYCRTVTIDSYDNVIGDDPGYFSTVGIIKCTSRPTVYINNLTQQSVNFFQNEFIGTYDQTECRDQTEKVYSYEFIVYDEADEVYYTTGEQLHQSAYDTEYNFSVDRVFINDFIKHGVTYSIQYKVTTENELVLETPKYKLTNEFLASPNEKIEMIPDSNVENGYVTINFKGSLDMQKSQHYILNDAALESEKDENGEYFIDVNGRTILSLLQDNLLHREERITFLKQNTIFKSYSSDDEQFLYLLTTNTPPNKTKFVNEGQIRFINTEEYENIQKDNSLSDAQKIEAILAIRPYYLPVASGREIVKNLSYKYVKDNLIDLKDYNLIQSIPVEALYYGSYILSRASDEDGYQTWFTVAQFRLEAQTPSSYSFRDMTVEHGRKYKYGLQQSNIWGLVSARIESEPYEVSFEDMFLYDGDKLLKIRFNPKVESFKTRVLEQKTDTIGGRFPYITRNGTTYYKEFPIGGMIACEMDEDQMFHKRVQGLSHRHSTNVVEENEPENSFRDWHMFSDENILLEREFKLAVLDWLNDGKPKLFKSPYEGNYIVRLMNNELKPVEELGRMLHTFSSQAYEITECSYTNLVAYGFVNITPPSDYVGQWRTYILNDPNFKTETGDYIIPFDAGLETFTIQDLMPGDMISLQFEGNTETEWEDIMIGITGSYSYTTSADKRILKIKIHPFSEIEQTSNRNTVGILNCYYQGARITAFDSIISQQLRTIPSQQFIGYSPWLDQIKRMNWGATTNDGDYSFELTKAQYRAFQGYNFRDFLDDAVESGDTVYYRKNANLKNYMYSFDPGELLEQINATIDHGNAYKIQLLDIEQAKFRLREVIPVYVVTNNMSPKKYSASQLFYGQKVAESNAGQTDNYQYVSTSPYGYPHRIEELTKYEMIDPYCIYEVFEINDNHAWQPVARDCPYYDPYYCTWLNEYDPTFKINYTWKKVAWILPGDTTLQEAKAVAQLAKDWGRVYDEDDIYDYEVQTEGSKHYYINKIGHKIYLDDHFNVYKKQADEYFAYGWDTGVFSNEESKIYFVKEYDTDISLATIKEKNYTELNNLNSIHIGTGVIAELTFQIKIIDYYTEVRDKDVFNAKQYYLNRRNFYNSLMKDYANIQRADYYRTKSRALRNAYNQLLNGNTVSRSFLSDDDKKIIRILLQNNYEVEQLRALKLYSIKIINSELDSSAVQALVTYKQNHINDNDGTYGTSRLKLYEYDTGGAVEYYALDDNNIEKPTVQNETSTKKTVYRQIDSAGNEYFYALDKDAVKALYSQANPSSLIAYDNLSFIFNTDYTSSNINSLVKNKEVLSTEGTYVYELTEVEDLAITEEHILLDDIEAEDIKLTDSYIYMREIPYSNNMVTTFFELRELNNLAQNGQNYLVEGVANKVRDLTKEVDGFNEQISSLLDLIESETNAYLEVYNNMKLLLDGYNTKVYTSWSYQELYKLLNAGQTWGAIYSQFNSNQEEIEDAFADIQNKIYNYIKSCENLYYLIKSTIPMIDLYLKMIDDGTDDQNLDQYLQHRVLFYRGTIVIAIVAMYEAIESIKEIVDSYPSFISTVYPKEIADSFNKYNEVYGLLVNLSDQKLLAKYGDYINDYYKYLYRITLENYVKLNSLVSAEPTYTDPSAYAEITNGYDDMAFLWKWIQTFNSTATSIELKNPNTNEKYIAYNVLPASNYSSGLTNINNSYATYFNTKFIRYYDSYKVESYNNDKQLDTYHYRTPLKNASGIANPTLYTTFIFYPLADNRKDPLIGDFANNLAYFNNLVLEKREQVLEVSNKLNTITLKILKNASLSEQNDINTFKNHINSNYLADRKPYNVLILDEEKAKIINPPIDEITGLVIENEINAYNNKILMAEASQVPTKPSKKLDLLQTTRPFFKVANGKAQSLTYTNIKILSDVYTNANTNEQTILEGYYKSYIDYLAGNKLVQLQQLLLEANKLLKLYQQQYANFYNKFNLYNDQFAEQEAIYSSYAGTEVMDYYLNPGNRTTESIRREVKEAWWTFLGLLDNRYTQEKERGMYV